MVTITETVATPAQLLTDIGSMLDSLSDWTREQSGTIQNTGDDGSGNNSGSWRDNSLLYSHATAGIYLLIGIDKTEIDSDGSDGDTRTMGIRFHISTDWDTELNHPAGLTDANGQDPWHGDVGFDRNDSFDQLSRRHNSDWNTDDFGSGVYWRSGSTDIYSFRSESVTYFASAGNDYINVAAWSPGDGNNGAAGYVSWELTDQKFWDDGGVPYVMFTNTNSGGGGDASNGHVAQYGFNHIDTDSGNEQFPYGGSNGFDSGAWGIVNPDANDDTFFFRRPVVYQTHQKRVPISYVYNVIANDRDEGGAHGDEITHNSQNFRIFRQTGMAEGTPVTAGLRYE